MEKFSQENYQEVISFIESNLDRASFIYGNLEFDNNIMLVFRDLTGQISALAGVLDEMYCTYLFVPELEMAEIENIIQQVQELEHNSGTVTGDYSQILKKYYHLNDNHLNECALLKNHQQQAIKCDYQMRYLNSDDSENYYTAVNSITEFATKSLDEVKLSLKNSRCIGIFDQDKLIASANLTAISKKTAVITGVFTDVNYRKQGLATAATLQLLNDYATNRQIFIFYNNPNAKSIYLHLGFKPSEPLIMFGHKLNEQD